jgi:hypothetical protein
MSEFKLTGQTYKVKGTNNSVFVTNILIGPILFIQWTTDDGVLIPLGILALDKTQLDKYEVVNDDDDYRATVMVPAVEKFIRKFVDVSSINPRIDMNTFMATVMADIQSRPEDEHFGGKHRPTAKVTEWKSTGRKVKVEGGRHKLVYRNRAGDLRVRKVTVNKQGHRVTRYVKY